jgi:AcrR family transcriptional regulator
MEQHHGQADSTAAGRSPRERIIHAALTLVSENGLDRVSMTDLAKAAGVSRQTLYNHYSDVGSVVADAISQHDAEALEQLTTSLSVCPTPRDALIQLVHHFAALGSQGHYYELEHALSAEAQEHLATYETAIRDLIRATLAEGVQSGTFRSDLDPTTDTALVYSLLTGVTEASARDPERVNAVVQSASRTIQAAVGRS